MPAMPAPTVDSYVFSRALGRSLPVVWRGQGACLWDIDGRRYLDGSGGAVVVNVGHGREEVAAAMARQAAAAAYVHGTQFTSDALEEYARRLAPHAPAGCDRLYLVSGGSEANETAVKLARAYQRARGEPSPPQGDPPLGLVPRQHAVHAVALRPAQPARALRAAARSRLARRWRRRSATTARSTGTYPDVRRSPARTSWRR